MSDLNKLFSNLGKAIIEQESSSKASNNLLEVNFKYSLRPDKPKVTTLLYIDFKAKTLVSRIEVKNETK